MSLALNFRIKSLYPFFFRFFVIKNLFSFQDSLSYLTANRVRLRDIELLTGLQFLPTSWIPEAELYDDEFAITLRTMIPEQLWMEKGLKR